MSNASKCTFTYRENWENTAAKKRHLDIVTEFREKYENRLLYHTYAKTLRNKNKQQNAEFRAFCTLCYSFTFISMEEKRVQILVESRIRRKHRVSTVTIGFVRLNADTITYHKVIICKDVNCVCLVIRQH